MKGLLTSIITLLSFTGLQAQSEPSTPKLIVGLTIDQLRTDYLEAFSTLYGDKGFKRLWRDGRIYLNAEFPFINPDRSSAIAAIYTGTTPSVNGIIADNWLDRSTLRPINSVDDPNYMGNYIDESTSPSQLLTSTITDELKIATQGKALVYAISPFRETAIIAAGHAGNGAFWLNTNTGKWASTTYYNEFPWWVSQYNDRKAIDFRIDKITWTPALPITNYKYLASEWENEEFKYHFDDAKKNKFRKLLSSPYINQEVNTLTEECLNNSTIGKDKITDFLSLTYYAGNYDHKSTLESPLETQDAYVRLDKSLAELFSILDNKIGLQNIIFFITSTGYVHPEAPDLNKYKIPRGQFYLNRCAALLNIYLMATYGEGQYVEAFYNQQIYLNHKLIEKKQLKLSEVQEKSVDFLMQFSGVNEVYSAHRLLLGAWNPEIYKIRNSFNRQRSGDLLISVLPGWSIVQEQPQENNVVRAAEIPTPLIFMGRTIKPEIIQTPVTVDRIAPTLTHFMRIRAPNASKALPISLIR
ncbi:alkaline phosphatase family protein [uncultured Bacteroides sp.]|uniref:alkaline phosphatase family protein n=1 Tax=uncultured Bacteroides sp. TaxID=162156 RepID=UPI002AABD69C|nr:alkaline phosphatase family protein [uncultured Bacteroides sp.]